MCDPVVRVGGHCDRHDEEVKEGSSVSTAAVRVPVDLRFDGLTEGVV